MAYRYKPNYPQIARESGFILRRHKDGPLDWRLIGSMEVDRILREQQFEHIDAILVHLSEAPLASMLDSNILDSGVAKYFTLSQLALQYMIFCRKFLDESVSTLRDNIIKLETQNLNLKAINQEHTNDILHLHKKLSQVEAIHEIVFPCHVCTKNFVSNEALNIHLSKKHLKSPTIDVQGKKKDQTLIDTIKLELEIKQLKERLNEAEKSIRQTSEIKRSSPRTINTSNSSSQVEIQMQNVGIQVDIVDNLKRDDLSSTKEAGIQCNFIEEKELDCTEREDNKTTNNHEKGVDDDKVDILFDIREKVSKLETSQITYSNGNQQSIHDIKLKLDEITEFIDSQRSKNAESVTKDPPIASDSAGQILPSISVDELHKMLSNMFVEVSTKNVESTNRIITNIEKTYEKKLATLEAEQINRKPYEAISTNIDSIKHVNKPIKENVFPSQSSRTTSSIERKSKATSSDEKDSSSSSSNTSIVESMQSFVSTKEKTDLDERGNIFHKLEKKMALYGLNIDSKSISSIKAAHISNHLLEHRNASANFNKTRNRLKKLVELLLSEKKPVPDVLKKSEQRYTEVDIAKNKLPDRRVERILRSPIKKPTNYVSHNTKDVSKPVPMPRKQVMFHTGNEK